MDKPPFKIDGIATAIRRAKNEISDAEGELDAAIGAMEVLARPEKVTVSPVVNEAFDRLRLAKTRLEELEVLLAEVEVSLTASGLQTAK